MNLIIILLFIVLFPFYIWVIGFVNAHFFISFVKDSEVNNYLEANGYEFVKCEEVKNDDLHKLEENLIKRFYSYKTYYRITAICNVDLSEKKIKLILSKSYSPFLKRRDLHYFEE